MSEEMKTETVQTVVSLASVLNHLKNNRLEYAVLTLLVYVTDIGATVWAQTGGMCV